jgi:hypothetical protein
VRIRVTYYDPIKNRYRTAKAKTAFRFTANRRHGDNLLARMSHASGKAAAMSRLTLVLREARDKTRAGPKLLPLALLQETR